MHSNNTLECITRCQVYKLKSELRNLHEMMSNPKYLKTLLNVLKNETRLHILQLLANGKYYVSQLQEELKKTGQKYSQTTISEECLQPLITTGPTSEAREKYYATTFGSRLIELLGYFPEFAEKLQLTQNATKKSSYKPYLGDLKLMKTSKCLSRQRLLHEFSNAYVQLG